MCMSVPQIAVLRTLMSTSLWPTRGSGMSCSQMPGSARALTRAFMVGAGFALFAVLLAGSEDGARVANTANNANPAPILLDDGELAPDLCECVDGAVQVRPREARGHLRADARLALRHHREREADDVDAVREQAVGHAHREARIAQHDRDDGMLAGNQVEAQRAHAFAEVARVVEQALAELGRLLEQVEHAHARGRNHGGDAVREQVRPRALAQPADDFLAA